jgi:hypothetical protein
VIDLDELESYDLKNADGELTDKEVTRAKFRLLGLFGQGHNIVIYICRLSARTDYFRKLIERIIPMNNRTRWNSWYNMFLILFELKEMIKQYYENYERPQLRLSRVKSSLKDRRCQIFISSMRLNAHVKVHVQ